DRGQHRAQSGQKFTDVRCASLEQAHEIDACGKYRAGPGQDHRARGRDRGKALGQRFAKIEAHDVGLAVGQAYERHTFSLADLDQARSPPGRIATPRAAPPTWVGSGAGRLAGPPARAATTRARAWCAGASPSGA